MGPSTNEEKGATSLQDKEIANTRVSMEPKLDMETSDQPEIAKEQGDDGGDEMVEGEEDTVIY